MRIITNFLSQQELQVIHNQIGQKLVCFWDPYLSPRTLCSGAVTIETTAGNLNISGDVSGLENWEGEDGWPPQYSLFRVNSPLLGYADIDSHELAISRGHVYRFLSGGIIEDVYVDRITISEFRLGEHIWDYVTDLAIIFQLSNGVLSFSKMGINDEILKVSIASSIDQLTVNEPEFFWDNEELEYEFSSMRHRYQIDDLIKMGNSL